jgi:hypothetical protein
MAAARRQANTWPPEQLFWELHPVMQWLLDKLLICFGRHEAPVVVTPDLAPNEFIVLFQGIISNQRSQPLITEWFGLLYDGQYDWSPLDREMVLTYTSLTSGLANSGQPSRHVDKITQLLPSAVKAAYTYMREKRSARADDQRQRLQEDQRKLRNWLRTVETQLNTQLVDATGARRVRLEQELEEVRRLQRQRAKWLTETFSSDPNPFLRVAAVFSGA